ncbi:MAG: hypothetical protein HC828_08740, partial [Blastochloris sp.]|nr:hypothetical protein [Blastochloris sp.]
MALLTKVIPLYQAQGTGNQSYGGVGFQPKVVLLFGNSVYAIHQATIGNFHLNGGAAVSSSGRASFAHLMGDNSANSFAKGYATNNKIYATNWSSTLYTAADFVSMDADGFTLNWVTVNAAEVGNPRKIFALCIGGDDLTDVAVTTFELPTTTGNHAVTGVGFEADCTLFYVHQYALATSNAAAHCSFGAAKSSSERFAMGFSEPDNATTSDNNHVQKSDKCVAMPWTNGGSDAMWNEADFVSHDSDGFTLDWSVANNGGGRYGIAVSMKGGQYKLGVETQKTSTGTKATTGVGFEPTGLLAFSVGQTSKTTIGEGAYASIAAAASSKGTFEDTFTGTLGAAITARSPEVGGSWTAGTGTFTLGGGPAPSASTSNASAWVDMGVAD